MRKTNKLGLIALLLAIIMTQGCKKKEAVIEKTEDVKTPEETPAVDPPSALEYLPAQLVSGTAKITFTYLNKMLYKVENTDGTSMVLTLDAQNKPEIFETYTGKVLTSYSEYDLNTEGLVAKISKYVVKNGAVTISCYFVLQYNSNHQMVSMKKLSPANLLLNERTFTYDSEGNLATEKSTSPAQTLTYTYDTKNGIFKHAGYVYLFSLETDQTLFLCAIHNLSGITGASTAANNINYSYTYNAENYPGVMKLMINGSTTSSYQVTYQ